MTTLKFLKHRTWWFFHLLKTSEIARRGRKSFVLNKAAIVVFRNLSFATVLFHIKWRAKVNTMSELKQRGPRPR